MFRKVQLKFFGIIVSILLAIFIAVLGSVNLIMNAVMERQTKIVLEQIAAGVEYDDKLSTFSFLRDDRKFNDMREGEYPPPKPWETAENSDVLSTTTATAAETTAQTTVTEISQTTTETVSEIAETTETEVQEVPTEAEEKISEEEEETEETQQTEETENSQDESDIDSDDDDDDDSDGDDDDDSDEEDYPPEDFTENFPRPEEWGGDFSRPEEWNGEEFPERPDWGYRPDWRDRDEGEIKDFAQTDFSGQIVQLSGTVSENTENNSAEGEQVTETPPVLREPDLRNDEREPVPKSLGSINFFIVMSDSDGVYLNQMNNDDLEQETAQSYITEVLNKNVTTGMLYNYQFCKEEKSNGILFVFADKTEEINMLRKLRRTTFLIGIISVIVLSIASYFLSGLIVRPLKETFEKQKQFISDASHELKTPLTVISANADVLSGEISGNKWLDYIQDQVKRMNVLVNELLNLTRLENNTANFIRTDFDLSKAVESTALPFECQAFEMNKNFVLDIDTGITVNGSEQHIKQMTAIFIDNAIKYSNDGGTVRVSLKKDGDKKILSVFNTGTGVKDSDKDKIFERFYKTDESRNSSAGGYGLGLAIAKSIADRHKFRIHVDNTEGKSICFTVVL